MSTLWTPSGEHPVNDRPDRTGTAPPPRAGDGAPGDRAPKDSVANDSDAEDADDADAEVEALRRRLAEAPVETVLANHCYGLFELGAVYLSADPPLLPSARLAIDAFGLLVEGLGDRLGEAAGPLRDALAQIRLGFVQVEAARRAANGGSDE